MSPIAMAIAFEIEGRFRIRRSNLEGGYFQVCDSRFSIFDFDFDFPFADFGASRYWRVLVLSGCLFKSEIGNRKRNFPRQRSSSYNVEHTHLVIRLFR